jgi:hypothetical protein
MLVIGEHKPNESKNPDNNPKRYPTSHLQGWIARPFNNFIKIIIMNNLKDN